jgi:polyhydroxyalkanoate synthase subunit PhaC
VDQVLAASGAAAINLLGVCQGGTFSLCYAALHPEKVANLIAMVTPVDFQTPDNMLSTGPVSWTWTGWSTRSATSPAS